MCLQQDGFADHHIVFGHVVVEPFATRVYFANLVNHVGARHHFAKHGITPTRSGGRGVVQEAVVFDVDEELGCGGMRVVGAGHGHGVAVVFQTIVGFIVDFAVDFFLFHAGAHAATLHHEARNHAVENCVVIVAVVHIVQKVGDGFRCLLGVKFERDDAQVLDMEFDLRVGHGYFTKVAD